VDREVDLALQQRVLDFLDEQPLAPDLGQRSILKLIAGCLDDDDACGRCAAVSQTRCDGIGLPEGELASARADAKLAGPWRHGQRGRP
jgi:hypothetical protein